MPDFGSLPPNGFALASEHDDADALLKRLRAAVAERYEIAGEVDQGGMAVVYRAHDRRDGVAVAIKVLRDELRTHVTELRFLREMELAARLEHPHIVPLRDSGQGERLLYYVMPLVNGESLADRIRREQNLSIPEALDITRQMTSALAYAHSLGIVHRDVKPQNILLSGNRALLADFGVHRAITAAAGDSLTQSGVTVGTTAYMSPEQAGRAKTVDGRADIYSLGCVLYEMLAGEPPFTGPNAQVVLARHLADPPPPLSSARPTVSAELQEVVERALAKVPADRFATAEEFGATLEQVEHGTYRLRGPKRGYERRARRAAFIGVGAVAAVAALWAASNGTSRSYDPNKIVVFPLVERGIAPTDSGAGADVALMIGAALEHTEPLRWLDGWHEMNERQRSSAAMVTARAARRITRDRGARFFIDGTIRQADDSIAVVLRLHDAVADSLVGQETVAAARGGLTFHRLGLRALARVITLLVDPGRTVDLAILSERAPAAVALWIQGERHYRRSQFAAALPFYERAVAADPALVYAASKGVQAAIWEHRPETARQLIAAARARPGTLPPRYGLFASAVEAYLDGVADSAAALFRQALAVSPDWAEALTGLGEVFYHLLPSDASPDTLAEASFAAAWKADSGFTPPLLHLTEIVLRHGDVDRARRFVQALPDSAIDQTLASVRALLFRCVESGRHTIDWSAVVDTNLHWALLAGKALSVAAAHPGCAEDGFRAVLSSRHAMPAYRWSAFLGLHGLMMAQGRFAEAATAVDDAVDKGMSQALYLLVFDVIAGAPLVEQASRVEIVARERFGPEYRDASPHGRLLLGVWHAHRGDTAMARRLHRNLVDLARETRARRARLFADALAAHIALADGDTADAIRRLRLLRPTAPRDSLVWDLWEPLAAERYLLARLLLARGNHQEALNVATIFDHPQPVISLAFLAPSLAIRLQAARALARADDVVRYQARLRRLGRSDLADPKYVNAG